MIEQKDPLTYAVVEDGIIKNLLAFDDEEIAKKFGCFPLSPNQRIGDTYISPDDWKKENFEYQVRNVIESV